jgi:SAM-dependent methyltransferase
MASHEQVRRLALALPEVVEKDHHGRPSFRVAGRIFATLWDQAHVNVMLDEPGIRTAVQAHPDVCHEVWWGKRLRAVRVDFERADETLIGELLADAWEQKAPARLLGTPRIAAVLHDFGLGDEDRDAWKQSGLPARAFEDWLIDRVARRPAGRRARETSGAEDVHEFARRAILEALALGPGDRLLEIGCGGGLLLREALAAGAAATGIDHSEEMVRLARERAPGAEILLARAERLPFASASFTAVAMSVVFLFLPDPVRVLRECHRVMAGDARLAVYTTSPELRGTPAAPEPLASHGRFHTDEALAALARRAGFANPLVVNDHGGQLLTACRTSR